MKKITVQDRAEKFINELGKYAVGNFKYWFPFCKLQKNISVKECAFPFPVVSRQEAIPTEMATRFTLQM